MRISDWSSDVCSSDLERQQAQDREKVAEKFGTIAGKREAGGHGYGDHNSDWKATPEALRKAVDAYNGANQHTKDLYIERIQREHQMALAVGQLIHERELVLQRHRGMRRDRKCTRVNSSH